VLFSRLGVDVQSISPKEFTIEYHRLARRYHPDQAIRTPTT
jgi:DnaJ-class molecular chaperone